MARLRVFTGEAYSPPLFELSDRERVVVGRASACDVVLHSDRVARRHFALERDGAGWQVSDWGSTNGTAVNGARVQTRRLADGDVISVLEVGLVFEERDEVRNPGLEAAIAARPGSPEPVKVWADWLLEHGDPLGEHLARALAMRPGYGDALFNLASLDLERGDFAAAATEYSEALPLFRAMDDRAGVAAILHSQGLIQAQAGEKENAVHSFKEALAVNQKLGDRAAEAGSFFQLGAIAVQQDRMAEGLRLMALAAVILRSLKSDEVKSVEPLVERLASELKYSQEQFMVMVQEVLQSYARDRGWGMVERAFRK